MKGLLKKSVGLLLVLVVCAMVMAPGLAQAADEDVPRVFNAAFVITPDADEDVPRVFSIPVTPNADEDVPRIF